MRALTRISAGNRKVWQGFVSGYGFSHIETSATMTALAAAVAPDRRGIEFQIVAARMNACPSRNLLPPPPTHNSHSRRFREGHEFTRADRASSLIVPSGREPARKALFSIRRSCKADSSELKFLGMTERKCGRNGTTESRALPVMSSPPPPTARGESSNPDGTHECVP